MAETRKLAAILVSDVVGYSRLVGSDEDRILARLRALRSDLIWGALIHASSGNSAAASAYANRALRLSPFDPVAFAAHEALGHVAFQEARYDKAALCYAKAVQANPRFSLLYFIQAVALALAGRVEEARPIVVQLLELNPGFRGSEVFEYAPLLHRALADRLKEGARLLGLPE